MPSPIFRGKIYSLAILNIKKYKLKMIELFLQIFLLLSSVLGVFWVIYQIIEKIPAIKRKNIARDERYKHEEKIKLGYTLEENKATKQSIISKNWTYVLVGGFLSLLVVLVTFFRKK